MVAVVDALGDLAGFVPGERDERLDDDVRPPGKRLCLGPGDRRGDQADVRRELRGKPGELFGLRRPLEPVERVEKQHHALPRRGPSQQVCEHLFRFRPRVGARDRLQLTRAQVAGRHRQRVLHAELAGQHRHPVLEEAHHRGGPGIDPRRVREQPELVPRGRGQFLVDAGKDGTLAAAGGARHDTAARVGVARIGGVRAQPPDDVRPAPEPARPLGDELFERRRQHPGLRGRDQLLGFGDHVGQEILDDVRDERPEARHRVRDRIPPGGIVAAPRAEHRVAAQLLLRRLERRRPCRRLCALVG